MKLIKFLDLKKNYETIKQELQTRLDKNVFESTSFILGPSLKQFEENFAQYIGSKYCIGVGNGTDALEISINALGFQENDEIITQANTFISTCLGITYNKLKIVLVDCGEDYLIDYDQIENKITSKTKAILIVHLYGNPTNMNKIMNVAHKYNLLVIEDCAQAHGAKFCGKKVGNFGHISCFSFYPGKNLGAYGDGGAIITNSQTLANKIYKLRNLGSEVKYHHELLGRNSRLDSIQAEILSCKLEHLDEWNTQRRKIAEIYDQNLKNLSELKLPLIDINNESVYHLYVIRTKKRDMLQKFLLKNGIETGIHYPNPINKLDVYKNLFKESYPNAELFANEILSLPMYPELEMQEVDTIILNIKNFFKQN